ncbi:Protein-lysine N-methyltransferase efm6 [Mycoemilia scoparia]|uniref:Protein-lysine N-methyltransferase efm6 n=1 Tax=Mycoemilia scoparia TaxID=417184 RepID=A0A9W7ZR96_9FUNG|nr:Protein-lysine N-methyltransferase efm6 [Mycoemilia scoparia]
MGTAIPGSNNNKQQQQQQPQKPQDLLMADKLSSMEFEFRDPSIEPLTLSFDTTGHGGVGVTIWDAGHVLSKYLEKVHSESTSLGATQKMDSNNNNKKDPLQLPMDFSNKVVLELGSGTGIVGLSIARFAPTAKRIILTDQESVLPILQHNIDTNCNQPKDDITNSGAAVVRMAPVDAMPLDWNKITSNEITNILTQSFSTSSSSSSSSSSSLAIATATKENAEKYPDVIIVSDCIYAQELHEPLLKTLDKMSQRSKTTVYISMETRDFEMEAKFFAKLGTKFRFRDIKPHEMDEQWKSEDDIFIFVATKK